ncbi:MAG: peptidylprolyl isomerase [Bacteroidales bacterium]|nr:peptidylprolyl isomerase [Bacteroidales bacterium]
MKKLIASLLICTGVLLGNLQAQNKNDVLVTIGTKAITTEEFLNTYSKNNNLNTASESDLRDYLDLFINFKMKVMEGEELQVDSARQFKMELQSYKKQSAQQYLVDKEVTEELVNEAIARAKQDIRASHILINCPEKATGKDTVTAYNKALSIRNEILAGKITFAEAAEKYSDDPSARDMVNPQNGRLHYGNKGDLGFFTVFDLIYPFECAAYKTKVGEISMPIRTRFGYHIIYVTDKIDAIQEISIAQIFVADTLARLGEQSATTAKRLKEIQNALASGSSFEEVVSRYSEDRTTDNGGIQEPFAPSRRQADFVKAILALHPDEISQPIASQNGWHIIKLIETKPVVLDEDAIYTLRNRISRDERSHKSKDSFIAKLKREYNYNESGRAKVMKLFLKNMPAEFFQMKDAKLQDIPGLEKLKPMCTYADQQITAEEFARYFDRFKGMRLSHDEFPAFLDERFEAYVQEKMIRYERDRLEEKYPEFRALVQEFHDGMILYEINTSKVWSQATKDSVGLEQYYEANKEKYIDPVTAEPSRLDDIRAIVITDYQEYLDKQWINELKKKYNPTINQKAFEAILKK